MMLFKSQINFYMDGIKNDFEIEQYVTDDSKNKVVTRFKRKNDGFSIYEVDYFKKYIFHDLLVELEKKLLTFELDEETKEIINIFENQKAKEYIDLKKCSDVSSYKTTLDYKMDLEVIVTIYKLSSKKILEEFYAESKEDLIKNLLEIVNSIIEEELLKKIPFAKSIDYHRIFAKSEKIKIEKINGHRICDLHLNPIYNTSIQYKEIDDIKLSFVKVSTYVKSYNNNFDSNSFIEDEKSKEFLVIVDRGKKSLDYIVKNCYLKDYISFGKIVLGITNPDDAKYFERL